MNKPPALSQVLPDHDKIFTVPAEQHTSQNSVTFFERIHDLSDPTD